MISTGTILRSSSLAIAVAAVASGLLVAPSPREADASAAQVQSQQLGSSDYRAFAKNLRRTAREHRSFGYFQLWVHRRIDLGFVGPVPKDIRAVIADAPEGATINTGRALETHRSIKRALRHVMRSDIEWAELDALAKGRGILVVTPDRDLYRSHNPSKFLGVHVGVIARRGQIPPAL